MSVAASDPRSNIRGLIYLGIGFFMFASADTIAKYMTGIFHPVQIVWIRQLGLLSVALVLLVMRGPGIFRSAAPILQVLRGSVAVLSAVCFVIAIRYVPLADAVAVSFVAPFLVTVLGALLLREHVSATRWVAIGIGFLGAMIVIRPGLGVFHPAIFLVLAAAVFFALRQVISRRLGAADSTTTTLSYTALISVLILSAPLVFVWQWPETLRIYLLLAAFALLAAMGEIMVIRAFEIAEAVVVAPMHYSLMIWATMYGWLVFGQLPDGWTWLGTAIILATGLYLINRERMRHRRMRRQAASDARMS